MRDVNVILYVIGTTIYTQLYRDNFIDAVHVIYKHSNHLLSDFTFTESCTVFNLFNSYSINSNSCQMWRFNERTNFF